MAAPARHNNSTAAISQATDTPAFPGAPAACAREADEPDEAGTRTVASAVAVVPPSATDTRRRVAVSAGSVVAYVSWYCWARSAPIASTAGKSERADDAVTAQPPLALASPASEGAISGTAATYRLASAARSCPDTALANPAGIGPVVMRTIARRPGGPLRTSRTATFSADASSLGPEKVAFASAPTTEPASPVSGWTRRAGLALTTAAVAPLGRPIIRSATAFRVPRS